MLDAEILVCAGLRELPFLNCCLRSIKRFWRGIYAPIVVVPPECRNDLPSVVHELRCTVVLKPVAQHAHVRMTLDCYMSSPLVLFIDVRSMFTSDCTIATFTDAFHKPVLVFETLAEAVTRSGTEYNYVINRKDTADDLLEVNSQYDYTEGYPVLLYRHSIRRTRELIEEKGKRPMAMLMLNYCPDYFSYVNVIGAHVWDMERYCYTLTPLKERATMPLRRFNGVMDPTKGEDLREVQRILA